MRMMRTVVLLALILSAGCGNKIDSKIDEYAAKPAATSVEEAKKLYDEIDNLIAWHEDPANNDPITSDQLIKAKALRNKRRDEMATLIKDKTVEEVSSLLDKFGLKSIDLKSVDVEATTDWFLGLKDPRFKKFGCPEDRPIEKNFGSRGCK
jgi:hypothetical protein